MALPIFAYLLVPLVIYLSWAKKFIKRLHLFVLMTLPIGLWGLLGIFLFINGVAAPFQTEACQYTPGSASYEENFYWGFFEIESLPNWMISDWVLNYFASYPYCGGGTSRLVWYLNVFVFMFYLFLYNDWFK